MTKSYEFGDPCSNIVLIHPTSENELEGLENEFLEITKRCDVKFRLIAAGIDNWNSELSPWKAPSVFGKEPFGNGASKTLSSLLALCSDKNKTYYIGGYSLAGLFSLWSAYQTDIFKGIAAVSPSMWFPGIIEYMQDNQIKTDTVYLSLGDKEEKTRNPIMATVGDRIRIANELLNKRNVNSFLEWNEGNHFKDADLRMAKGFAWLLNA